LHHRSPIAVVIPKLTFFQLKATDKDKGVNSQIKYSITGGDQKNNFTIDADSGLITTATKLDYETKKSYQLTITGMV
jgi:hypothetical protein